MSKIRALTIAVVVLILLNVALVAFFASHGGPPPRPVGPKRIIIERLHFDTSQVNAFELAITAHQNQVQDQETEQKRLRNVLYALLQETDRNGADSIASAIGAVQARIELIHLKHFEAIEAICRPEQKADFTALSHELSQLFRGPPPMKQGRP
ncbi:MAG: hypothetical protein WBO28_10300 [Flavobacteriales bacterium]